MKRNALYIVVSILVGILLWSGSLSTPSAKAAPCVPTNYPTFGFDMQRTSYNPFECILSSSSVPNTNWVNSYYSLALASREGISNFNNRNFIALESRMLSLDAFSGGMYWSFGTGAKIIGAPTIHLNRLFFGSQNKNVYSLDPMTGATLWVNSVGVPISTTPAAFERLVFVSMDNGVVYAFDALSGAVVWRSPYLGKVLSSPAVFDKKVYVSALVSGPPDKSVVYALDYSSGSVLWNTPGIAGSITAPVLANKRLYVGANDTSASVHAFNASSGAPLWSNSTSGEPVYGKPAVDEKQVYVVSAWSGKLYALDAFGGSINWATSGTFSPIYKASSPTVANGIVYVGGSNINSTGWVYTFKTSGTPLRSHQVQGLVDSPITVVNGWFYATTYNGYSGGFITLIFAFKG